MSRRLPVFLRQTESAALLAEAQAAIDRARTPKARRRAERDSLVAQCFLFLGLRVAELCKLTVPDVNLEARSVFVNQGKGKKDRYVSIPGKLVEPLRAWIGERKAGPLFPSPSGGHLTTRCLQGRIPALAKAAGIGKRVRCHSLRHSYATRLLETGATIYEVKELLGHSNIGTTERYLHTCLDRLKGAVDRL